MVCIAPCRFIVFRFAILLGLLSIVANAQPLNAHELQPAEASIYFEADQIIVDLAMNVEAILADVSLESIEDTDESENAQAYDELVEASAADLTQRFEKAWPTIAAEIELQHEGEPLQFTASDFVVPEAIGDGTSRLSKVKLSAERKEPVVFQWAPKFGPLILRVENTAEQSKALYASYLAPGQSSVRLSSTGGEAPGAFATFIRYVVSGFEHIIPKGLDHILFVLGLFFLSLRWGSLLAQITVFTLAHTITLALATTGWVTISPTIVEPLIAASIVVVAVENIFRATLSRWRLALVFGFGLLHGLGFASVLGDVGLGQGQFLVGLLGFNIGVELGQLAVVGIAFLGLGFPLGDWRHYRRFVSIPASIIIAAIAVYWVIERVFL